MTQKRSDRVSGMAVFYGFFFTFVAAIVTLNEQVIQSTYPEVIPVYFLFLFLLSLAITLVGYGLYEQIVKEDYPKFFKWGIWLLTTIVPIVLLVVMGGLLGLGEGARFTTIAFVAVIIALFYEDFQEYIRRWRLRRLKSQVP